MRKSDDHSPFLWGAASAGHQVEGNNVNSDIWLMEHLSTTVFKEPSGDACNSFEMWQSDLEAAKAIGLTCYRFSLEWARIEPEEGHFSQAMLEHYARIIKACKEQSLEPVVTLNHFSNPTWFAAKGGWTNRDAIEYFSRYCEYVGQVIAGDLHYVLTFNEPNILRTLSVLGVPQEVWQRQEEMLNLAAKKVGSIKFSGLNACLPEDFDTIQANLIEGHRVARDTLKRINSELEVGFSLALLDDQALDEQSLREEKCEYNYGAWLRNAEYADFIGVQNYERVVWGENGAMPVPDSATTNMMGGWIDPTSLAHCVEYVFTMTGKPVMVTEHGIATDDDALRAWFIESSLTELQKVMQKQVPVLGYIHWTLIDNYEWVHGYDIHFGLCAIDPKDLSRRVKPSAMHYRGLIQQYRSLSL